MFVVQSERLRRRRTQPLRMSDPNAPALVSHVLSIEAVPVASFVAVLVPAVAGGRGSFIWKDAWIMANAFILTTGIADGTKKLVGRQRPAFHYGVQGETEAAHRAGGEPLVLLR